MPSPIEQFQIFPVLVFSNLSFYMIMIFFTLILLQSNKNLFSKHIEWWYPNFQNVSSHIFILLTIWFLILFSNLLGMVPYSNTITAQTVIVLSISVPTFIAINWLGIKNHGLNLFYLFLPLGVPTLLIPVIVAIELFSYFIRLVSITLRLFANMVSGHILVKIIIYALIPMPFLAPVLIPIVILELGIAFVQAYVFLTLTLSYYQDVFLPH